MKHKNIAIQVLVSVFIVTFAGVAHAFNDGDVLALTKENFDRVVRAIWEENHGLRTRGILGESEARLCIAVPTYPKPDSQSKAQNPLSWHLDFFSNPVLTKDRDRQLRQLDALVKVGLMKKVQTMIEIDNEVKKVVRYSLTEKGWAASDYNRGTSCFVYGASRYLGVSRYERKNIGGKAGAEIVEVHARVGLASENDLEPWARDQEILAEFTEIKRQLDGQEFVVMLARSEGEWVNYVNMIRDEASKKREQREKHESAGVSQQPRISAEMKPRIDELNRLPAPTPEEIRKLLEAMHGVGQKDPWPIPCLYLPGSERLPVDKALFTFNPSRYSVAIFSNKERAAYDRVANKTLPYLNMLERLGILSKTVIRDSLGKGSDAESKYDTFVYKLASPYENRIHPNYPYCFPLGKPVVEFVDIQIAESDENGFPNSSFRYKLKVMYKSPPTWMRDAQLMDEWADLRGVIEHGVACEGKFNFNRKTREQRSGSGSCWLAFDSYYENY